MNHPHSPPSPLNHLNLNKFNYHSQPAHSLLDTLQSQFHIKSLEISPHGKTGVFFIETDNGSFVLKSNNEGPIDQFFNKMAALLDLNVPQSICYNCSDLTFHKILFKIQKFCARDEMLYARIKSRLDFPFYQIMEYIPSISMAEIGKDRFQTHLLDQVKLYSMGMCLAFDLITNNSDRFKLLWNGDGNINNVLIEVLGHDAFQMTRIKDRSNTQIQLGSYMFIDHSGYLIDLKNPLAAKNFEIYMKKVVDFQINLIRSLTQQYPIPKEFDKLRQQIFLYTQYTLTNSDINIISKGIIYATHKFIQIFQSKALEQLYTSMKKQNNNDSKNRQARQNNYWNDYWNSTLNKISLNFLQEVYTKMAAIYATYPEIIPKIIAQMEQQVTEQMRPPSKVSIGKKEEPNKIEEQPQQNGPQSMPTDNLLKSDPQMQSKQEIKTPSKRNQTPKQQESPYSKEQNQDGPEDHDPYKHNEKEKQAKQEPKVRKWRQKLKKFAAENSNQIQKHG